MSLCFGAPISNDSSDELTNDDIANLRTFLLSIPGAKPDTVNQLTEIFQKLNDGETSAEEAETAVSCENTFQNRTFFNIFSLQKELLIFCLSAGTRSSMTKDEWNELFDSIEEETKITDIITTNDSSPYGLTDEDLAETERQLKKKLSMEQTERVMKIFRKFHKDATTDETSEGVVG